MSDQFIGEIRIMSFVFAPRGWAQCNGQLLPINQNQALFALLGTTYGGNGQTNFALPNLQARTALHRGNGFVQGQLDGVEAVTLTSSQMPAHIHSAQATSANATTNTGAPNLAYAKAGTAIYGPLANATSMAPGTLSSVGSSQPHENRQPFLVLNACIALQGIFPSRN
jgi:microcystin-dependent protein